MSPYKPTHSPTRLLVACLAAFAWLAHVGRAAGAAEGDATRAVRRANETVAALLKETPAASDGEKRAARRVAAAVRDFLDIDELGRRAMAARWKSLSAGQRRTFLSLLRELVEENYIKGMRARLAYQVEYLGEAAKGDAIVVSTEVNTRRRGRPFEVTIAYVVRWDGDRWRAYDIVTDGIGLVENYRAQFNRIIEREGTEGLLSRMKRKRDQLRRSND